MGSNDRELQYGPAAWLLHWLTAVALLAMFAIAWYMTGLPKGPERGWWYGLHKSLGLSVALLVGLRLYWRTRAALPAWPADWPRSVVELAVWGHRLMYLLLIVIPLAGFLTSAYTPNPLKFWGFELPRLVAEDKALNAAWKQVHNIACYTLLAVLSVHVLAALRHLLGGSRRMLTWRRA